MGGGGEREGAGWGSGQSGDGVRGCFCFEMSGLEFRKGAQLCVPSMAAVVLSM